ncbi:hypothetical protein IQ255_23895 [Pleurocapsales cyanobacterium LEGE 10410]|nr:hypothetical protein [Pleurocapsales cyanobacterium LEGE 10410]
MFDSILIVMVFDCHGSRPGHNLQNSLNIPLREIESTRSDVFDAFQIQNSSSISRLAQSNGCYSSIVRSDLIQVGNAMNWLIK